MHLNIPSLQVLNTILSYISELFHASINNAATIHTKVIKLWIFFFLIMWNCEVLTKELKFFFLVHILENQI